MQRKSRLNRYSRHRMALRKSKSKSKSAIFICVAVAIIISVIVMLDYVSSSESDELLGQIELERERQLEKLNQHNL